MQGLFYFLRPNASGPYVLHFIFVKILHSCFEMWKFRKDLEHVFSGSFVPLTKESNFAES